MHPEPPTPPKPSNFASRQLSRRGSDARLSRSKALEADMGKILPGGLAGPSGQPLSPALAATALASLPGPAGAPGLRLSMRWALPLWAASAAAVAAAAAWLLAEGLALSAPAAAALAAAVGLLLAAVPGWALATRRLPAARVEGPAPRLEALSGMVSRATFMDLAGREWSRARRYGTGAALLLVDVDRYARLCDMHGAGAGDALLAELALRTAPTLRGADAITRLGPSRLAVFLAQADPTGALDVAERIRERAETLDLPFHSHRLKAVVSVGVAPLRPAHLNLQALLDDSEDAVLAARQAGGNCVRAAPVDLGPRTRPPGSWRDDHRARPQ